MTLHEFVRANTIQGDLLDIQNINEVIRKAKDSNDGDVRVKFFEDGYWWDVPQKVVEYWLQYNKDTSKELEEEFEKL